MSKILETVLLTNTFDVHQDWEVPIPGFFIIASVDSSKRSIAEFSDAEITELALIIKRLRIVMKDVLGIEVVYIFENEDTRHGFHVWIFPRHEWMKEFGIKIESVRPIINYSKEHMMTESALTEVKEAAAKVRAALGGKIPDAT